MVAGRDHDLVERAAQPAIGLEPVLTAIEGYPVVGIDGIAVGWIDLDVVGHAKAVVFFTERNRPVQAAVRATRVAPSGAYHARRGVEECPDRVGLLPVEREAAQSPIIWSTEGIGVRRCRGQKRRRSAEHRHPGYGGLDFWGYGACNFPCRCEDARPGRQYRHGSSPCAGRHKGCHYLDNVRLDRCSTNTSLCWPILTLLPSDEMSWEEAYRPVTSLEHRAAAPAMSLERRVC